MLTIEIVAKSELVGAKPQLPEIIYDGSGNFDFDALVEALNKLRPSREIDSRTRSNKNKTKKKSDGRDLQSIHSRTDGLSLDKDSPNIDSHIKEQFDFDQSLLKDFKEQKPNMKKPHKHLPLPAEIRTKIYEYILLLPNCLKSNRVSPRTMSKTGDQWPGPSCRHDNHYPFDTNYPDPLDLSLLLVSKATYTESYHIFYRANTLYFKNTPTLLTFLRHIGHVRRQALRDIGFDWVGNGNDSQAAFRLLASCGGLETVRFTINRLRPPGYEALREVRGLKDMIRLPKAIFNEYTGRKGEEWWEAQHDKEGYMDALELEDWLDVVYGDREEAFEALRVGMMRPRGAKVVEWFGRRDREIGLLGGKVKGVGEMEGWEADGVGLGEWFGGGDEKLG